MQRTVAQFSSAAAGDVVKAVKTAKLTCCKRNGFYGGLWIDGISADGPAGIAQLALSSSHTLWLASHDDYFRAMFDEGASGRKAKTRCAADDDDRFSIEARASHVRGVMRFGRRQVNSKVTDEKGCILLLPPERRIHLAATCV